MRVSRLLAVVFGLAVPSLVALSATDAAAAACPPGKVPVTREVRDGPTGKTVRVTICVSGGGSTTPPPSGGGGDGDGDGDGEDNDGNYTICTPLSEVSPGFDPTPPPGTPPDAVPYQCVPYIGGLPVYGPYIPQWLTPGAVPLPSPQQVAADTLADVAGLLHDPELVGYPAFAVPAVLDVPTFVSVDNWQPAFTEAGCDPTGAVCIEIDLEPALTFDPGDGSDVVACPPGGTEYDPSMGTPREVAVEGTCTHPYGQRTGVDGRPEAWPAEVTVTWSVAWRQTNGGAQNGVLDDIPLPATFEREVEEVQSVGVPSDG